MTDQKPITQDDLREIADVLETDSHYSGSGESKRRAGYAAKLREHAAAMDAASPVAWMNKGGSLMTDRAKRRMIQEGEYGGEFAAAVHTAEAHNIPLFMHPAQPASELVGAWQPIETCPRDGRLRLFGRQPGNHVVIGSIIYSDEGPCFEPDRAEGENWSMPQWWMEYKEPPANLTGANNG